MSGVHVVPFADAELVVRGEEREVHVLVERPALTLTWSRFGAGQPGTDPHVHHEHTDAFYVIDGDVLFTLGTEQVALGAGTVVAIPPDVVHAFASGAAGTSRWLNAHAPSVDFAPYLRALGTDVVVAFDADDPPADGGRPADGALVSRVGEGERLGDDAVGVLLRGAVPQLCVSEWTLRSVATGPTLTTGDTTYFVLDGAPDLMVDGTAHALGPGAVAAPGPGTSHALAHRGPGEARVVGFHAPGPEAAAALRSAFGVS